MKAKKPKRPSDPMELAKLVGDMATGKAQRDDESLRVAKPVKQGRPIPVASKRSASRPIQKRSQSDS